MFEHFIGKWRLWQKAFMGIDDLHGDYLSHLEKRIARLEAVLENGSKKSAAGAPGMEPSGQQRGSGNESELS